jgi:DNA-binding transcriptional ArsR family regulator
MLNNAITKWVAGLLNYICSPPDTVSAAEKHVLLAVLSYANWNHHTCFPGVDRLSRDTSYSPRRVRAALKALTNMGYLELVRAGCRGDGNGRGRMANEYRVHVPNEILPEKYRTKRHDVPERHAGLNGKNDGLSGRKVPDQPAPRAPQDIKEVIYIQDNAGSGSAGASHSFEKEQLLNDARSLGMRESHVVAKIRERGFYSVAEAMGRVKQWQPAPDQADGALERAMQGEQVSKGLRLPNDDTKLPAFAQQHGLSEARPGEEYFDYRNRLNAELKQR